MKIVLDDQLFHNVPSMHTNNGWLQFTTEDGRVIRAHYHRCIEQRLPGREQLFSYHTELFKGEWP